jgi:hypothetical protein
MITFICLVVFVLSVKTHVKTAAQSTGIRPIEKTTSVVELV